MMRYLVVICCLLVVLACNRKQEKKEVKSVVKTVVEEVAKPVPFKTTIYAKDSLPITADIYEVNGKKPTVLLCHQAGYSRGEYKDTALQLMEYGFSCVAIDQRSGKEANGITNETALKATEMGLATNYLDARQDIEAAIDYLYEMNGNQPVIVVGSSYSATLALLIAGESDKVKAVAAFSPGEYFKGMSIKNIIKDMNKPIFVTSSKKEAPALEELVSLIDSKYVVQYKPEVEGIHGSRALWKSTEGSKDYWDALKKFHKKYFE